MNDIDKITVWRRKSGAWEARYKHYWGGSSGVGTNAIEAIENLKLKPNRWLLSSERAAHIYRSMQGLGKTSLVHHELTGYHLLPDVEEGNSV